MHSCTATFAEMDQHKTMRVGAGGSDFAALDRGDSVLVQKTGLPPPRVEVSGTHATMPIYTASVSTLSTSALISPHADDLLGIGMREELY